MSVRTSDELNPVEAYLSASEGTAALAIIVGVDGPSYRPLGAMMTLFEDRRWIGTLSSGCIEADIDHHAKESRRTRKPMLVKYGKGSPYIDIKLPCGGGLEICILPDPDRELLKEIIKRSASREATMLVLNVESSLFRMQTESTDQIFETIRIGDQLHVRLEPDPQFLIFGKGPEASTFSALTQAAGYPCMLLSPDDVTLQAGVQAGCQTRHIAKAGFPSDLAVDRRTAIVLFFHDHDWEPEILFHALETDAFYIGAQGSQKASIERLAELQSMGISQSQLDRLSGPIGLIPSTRDAKTLSVSVLAEILSKLKRG